MRRVSLVLGLVGAVTLAAASGVSAATAAKAAAAAPAGHDSLFMTKAAGDGMAEVQLAQLATQRAANADVKSFAQMLVDDHTKANDELKGLAGQKSVTLPAEPPAAAKATYDRLGKLSGAAFDRAYTAEMVRDHQKAVALFTQESKTGHDADAKGWAAKTLPTLEHHLARAKELAGGPKTASAHTH
jgi:putative membrane protein